MQNGIMMQYFQWYLASDGNFWKQVSAEAEKIARLGITAVWLPPAYKANAGADSVGYDVYDIYDLGEFDQKGTVRTKYGTKDEYIAAINALHEHGIAVYVDVVLNHMAGADESEKVHALKVNEDNRLEVVSDKEEIEAYTKFTFPGRNGTYSQFIWDKNCFTGVDYAHNKGETAVYSIQNEYGEGWEDMVSDEKGNYDYLMFNDIEFRNPAVREELKRWGKWYWHLTHFDGVRLDAVKHIPPQFYNEWLDDMRANTKPDLFAVAEYWAPGELDLLMRYIDATGGKMSLFDAPLHHNFYHASKAGKDYNLAGIFDNSLTAAVPQLSVTVVENHDTQPLQALEASVEPWFKPLAYALILLRESGYPCLFYTDLYGASYTDKGSDGNDHEIIMTPVHKIEELLRARKEFAYGVQRDYFDHGNCIGWTREGDDDKPHTGCAVVMSNGEAGFKNMEIGTKHAGSVFIDLLQQHPDEITIDENGRADFYCKEGSVSVWIQKESI